MVKIDKKDRKILHHLDLDSRQSFTQIGKKVGLKKDTVAYRVNRMQEEGIIKNFWTVIDTFKLGYIVVRAYLRFQYTPLEKKKEIIQHFCNYRNAWSIVSVKGDVDIASVFWVKNIYKFYKFWDETLNKYGDHFEKKILSIYIQADEYQNFFIQPELEGQEERKKFSIGYKGKTMELDQTDYEILDTMALNARMPLIDIADKLGCSSQTVNYRIKKMMDNNIIIGFRTGIDISKFDLQIFSLTIDLKDHTKREKIIKKLESKPYLKCVNTAVGYKDLEMELILENIDEINNVLQEIEKDFPNAIRSYTYLSDIKSHKERWLPELYTKE